MIQIPPTSINAVLLIIRLPSKLECVGTVRLATSCNTILFSVSGIHWLLYEFPSKVIISDLCHFSLR